MPHLPTSSPTSPTHPQRPITLPLYLYRRLRRRFPYRHTSRSATDRRPANCAPSTDSKGIEAIRYCKFLMSLASFTIRADVLRLMQALEPITTTMIVELGFGKSRTLPRHTLHPHVHSQPSSTRPYTHLIIQSSSPAPSSSSFMSSLRCQDTSRVIRSSFHSASLHHETHHFVLLHQIVHLNIPFIPLHSFMRFMRTRNLSLGDLRNF